MKLKCPDGVTSISVGGAEYTATDGHIEFTVPDHADAAKLNGFTEPVAVVPRNKGE